MKIRTLFSFGVGILLLGLVADVSAEKYMYKWKGDDGEIHYTERPPQGVPFEKIRVQANKADAQPTKPVKAHQDTPLNSSKKDSAYETWRAENCQIAIQNLDVLRNAGRISQDDGQGGTRLMTDEEKQANIQKMEQQKEKYCSAEEKDPQN